MVIFIGTPDIWIVLEGSLIFFCFSLSVLSGSLYRVHSLWNSANQPFIIKNLLYASAPGPGWQEIVKWNETCCLFWFTPSLYSLIKRLGHVGDMTLNYANHVYRVPITRCKSRQAFWEGIVSTWGDKGQSLSEPMICSVIPAALSSCFQTVLTLGCSQKNIFCHNLHINGCESPQLKIHQTILRIFLWYCSILSDFMKMPCFMKSNIHCSLRNC